MMRSNFKSKTRIKSVYKPYHIAYDRNQYTFSKVPINLLKVSMCSVLIVLPVVSGVAMMPVIPATNRLPDSLLPVYEAPINMTTNQNILYSGQDNTINNTIDSRQDNTISPYYSSNSLRLANAPSNLDLPDLGNGSGRFVEEHHHQALGKWLLQHLNSSVPLLLDPWINEVLDDLAWQLNAKVRSQAPLALLVINDQSINAFAIPGGVIGINVGTVLAANSIDEIASVLSHEVAHLSQRHYEHREQASKKAMMVQIGTLLAAIAASSANGDAATAILMGGQTVALNQQMSFSRDNEREADRIGMQILAETGYDPRAMPQFFATLNQKSQLSMSSNAYLPSFVMTHPLSAERLSEAQARANSYAVQTFSQYSQQTNKHLLFDLLKWRVALLSGHAQENVLAAAAKQSEGAKLALASFYTDKGRYNDAQAILDTFNAMSALQRQSLEPLLSITQAGLYAKQGQWQQAVTRLQPMQQLYPERRDLRLYLADALLGVNDIKQAQALLLPLLERTPYDIGVLERLQLSYERLARDTSADTATIATINALRYRSQAELWHARYDEALVSLEQAKSLTQQLDTKNINPKPLLAKINSQIATVKDAKAYQP